MILIFYEFELGGVPPTSESKGETKRITYCAACCFDQNFLGAPPRKRLKIVGVLNRFHSHVMRVIRSDEDTPTGTIVFTIAIVMMGDSCHGRVSQVSRIRDNHPL